MKKNIVKALLFIVFLIPFSIAFAQSLNPIDNLKRPAGGKILFAPVVGIDCPAGKPGSPFNLVSLSAPGLLIGDFHPTSNYHKLLPSIWFLGNYLTVPIPECQVPGPSPAPVSGYRTIIHGTSVQIDGI